MTAAALFCWLSVVMLGGHVSGFDATVRTGVHDLASPWLTAAIEALTWLGTLGVLALFGVIAEIVLIRAGRLWDAKLLLVTMGGAVILENALKFSIQRPRPPPFFGTDPTTFSYPSGHALFSLCFYGALAVVLGRTGVPRAVAGAAALILVGAIGFTRIYLGVHYPSDVLGGYLVATAWLGTVLAGEAYLEGDHGRRRDVR